MPLNKLDHIGIAVKDLDESIKLYERLLGVICYKIEEVKDQFTLTAFFKIGNIKIELISSTKPDTALHRFLEKKGEGLHHIAFEVKDVLDEVRQLEEKGFKKIGDKPSLGADQKQIQFIHPETTQKTLIELCADV